MTDESLHPNETVLRDKLAPERTRMANERTLLSYLRTAFMLVVAGGTALKVFVDTPGVVFTSWLFIGLGMAMARYSVCGDSL